MECPTERILERFSQGELSDAEIYKLEKHLDDCASCRQTIAALTRLAHRRDLPLLPSLMLAGFTLFTTEA